MSDAADNAASPFRITGPAVISFSGGRTSAYMLWRILKAHGGALPNDVLVCFANTGREMPATLDFVRDCSAAWNVPIRWIEFRQRRADGFEEVSHNSASRAGEPFAALLAQQSALPNPVQRSCTQELKIRTIKRFILAERGWQRWTNVVGLRADEPGRVFRATRPSRDRWIVACPLHEAGVTEPQVLAFWSEQPFDLRLRGKHEGNCDGCFLKARSTITRMIEDHPERMRWWADMEATPRGTAGVNRRFRADRESYAEMFDLVERQGALTFNVFEPEMGCHEWACTE